jgi:hypothetical protein
MGTIEPAVGLALVRIALGVYWLSNAIRDFQLGRHKEMGMWLQMMARDNPIGWYGAFMRAAVVPYSSFYGYFIPISMLLIGISLLTGVATTIALVGAIVLCVNVLLAFGLAKERPQLALLIISQLALLLAGSERAWSLASLWVRP